MAFGGVASGCSVHVRRYRASIGPRLVHQRKSGCLLPWKGQPRSSWGGKKRVQVAGQLADVEDIATETSRLARSAGKFTSVVIKVVIKLFFRPIGPRFLCLFFVFTCDLLLSDCRIKKSFQGKNYLLL